MGSQTIIGQHPFPLGSCRARLYVVVTVLLARTRLWPGSGAPMTFDTDMKLRGISNTKRRVMCSSEDWANENGMKRSNAKS